LNEISEDSKTGHKKVLSVDCLTFHQNWQ